MNDAKMKEYEGLARELRNLSPFPGADHNRRKQGEAADAIDALLAEVRKLTDALPRTADGVTIVPGMMVWLDDVTGPWTVNGVAPNGFHVQHMSIKTWPSGSGYSTESAARAAAGGEDTREANDGQ